MPLARARRTAAALAGTVALGLLGAVPAPADAAPRYQPWGSTSSKDFKLKVGCHPYRFSYRITAPTDEWAAEFFVVNPNGRTIASPAIDAGSDPERGTITYTVCKPSTVRGVHKIKMKVTWQDGRFITAGFTKPTTFRFTR